MKELFSIIYARHWRKLFCAATDNSWIRIFRYVFVGGGAFLIDFCFYCLLESFGLHYLTAGLASFVAGFAFNFMMSRRLVFATADSYNLQELLSVLIISIIGLGLTEFLLYVGTDMLQINFRLSKIIASILVLFWNYAARKLFVYRH